jgi:predicted DNA binding CopG/RHH family protein
MSKKEFKRINLRVDSSLYNKIKKEADDSYLRIGTYIRQLIQKVLKNNIIKN